MQYTIDYSKVNSASKGMHASNKIAKKRIKSSGTGQWADGPDESPGVHQSQ